MLLADIDQLVGKRGRSNFLATLATREVNRRKLLELLSRPGPVWKSKDDPELEHGAAAWVRKMRRTDDKHRMKRARFPQ